MNGIGRPTGSGEAGAASLRIALVSETWFPQVNGVSRSLEKLVESLVGSGDTIRLFIPRYTESCLPTGVSAATFRSISLPFYSEVLLPVVTPATVARQLSDFRPDVVHIATEGPLGRAALTAARRLGLPVVSSYHTSFAQYLRLYGAGWLEGIAWRYLRSFHNATAATFCPTPSIRAQLIERGFERVEIWSRGVSSAHFHPGKRDSEMRHRLGIPENAIALACCGRLATEKNIETLLAAFRQLPSPLPVHLLLIGDGPLRPKLEAAGDPLVIFTGYQRGEVEPVREKLPLLASSAVNLRAIITNILDLSKIEAGRMDVVVESFDLADLLLEVAETTRVLLGDKAVVVEVAGAGEPCLLDSDAIKVRQILVNLTSNAAKFTDRGTILLTLERQAEGVRLAVSDTGPGIREADLEKLFTAFSQFEDARTRRHERTGLGLTITRQMVGLLGGRIHVDSIYGQGTTFTVSLPAAIPQHERAANE